MPLREKPDPYPEVPPSLNHDSFEMQDVKRPRDNNWTAPPQDTAGDITPYLGLRARLSQIWINRWTVLLILVLVRVLILIAGLNDDIGDAKAKALQACTKVEDIGSAMASMPHYLSVGVNEMAGVGISKAVHAMVSVLMMILTGVEQLIMFVINFYIGMYICLTAALIHGTLDVAVGAADAVTKVINDGIKGITDGLANDVSGVQNTINSIFDAVNSATGLVGKHFDPPKIDVSGRINDLHNIKVDDTAFVKSIVSLNGTIPTYDEAENLAKKAISIPFEMVKTALNSSYGAYAFDTTIFPVANKQALTFCSDNSIINDFFETLYKIARDAKIAFIVVLLVLAVLACVPMSYMEIRRFRRQRNHARVFTQHGYDSMDVVYIASRPITATAGIKIASKFRGKRQLLARWAVAYATSLPAIFVLSLAVAGFFSCFCQWVLLRAIEKEAPALANQVGDFAAEVVTTLEDVSEKWATDANGVLLHFQDEVNNDVLGYVVNATSAVNNTLNTFTDEINKGISAVFGGTVLDNTVHNVVRCLIGLKIEAVEKGLTWVHDNAHVTLPLFPNDTFSTGAQKSISGDSDLTSFLSSPSSVTTDEITAAVDHVVNYLHNNMIQEALISTGLLLVYVIVVLLGVMRSLAGMITPDRTHGDGGQRFLTGDGRAPLSPRQSKGEGRFPRSDDGAGDTLDPDDDGGHPAAVRGGRGGMRTPGHFRASSHGRFEDVGR